jgi:hypothetical protein
MDKFLNTLTISVVIILLAITVVAKATETSNVLSNGSFDGGTEGWELDGTAQYDGNTYSGSGLDKVVRFSGSEGGSVAQSVPLNNITSDNKYISEVHGSIKSYGCNNTATSYCTNEGNSLNLDPVNTTITFTDGTNNEVLNYDFTSNYNDGVITSTFTINLENDFNINNTTVNVNVFGADKGNGSVQLGSIIDNLSLTLTLANLAVIPEVVIPVAVIPTIQIGNLDSTSIADTISTGIIDIKPIEDMQIQGMNIADANHNHEMPVQEIQTINMPELQVEMPDIQMPDLEMPDIEMPDNLPVEINNVEIEPVNEPEPETLQEIREEIPVELEPEELKQEDTHEKDVKQENKEKEEGVLKEPAKNEKAVTPTKTTKVEKKRGSESPNKSVKKVLGTTVTPKIESNIIVKELDLLTVVSFNKQYFENTYKDIISLTTTEVAFYEQDGFNSTDYTKANTNFFSEYRNTNSEWDMVSKRDHIKIEQFRR